MGVTVVRGDARQLPLPDESVDLVVTSPPYFGLRSYTDGGEHYRGQIGSEATPAEWLASLLVATREWVRVLKPSGSIFVNLGDKYAGGGGQWENDERPDPHRRRAVTGKIATHGARYGYAHKTLMGLPWRYALACTDQLGLILRRDIIWHKPNGLPESVTDRCRSSHEYLFHFTRQPRYYSAVDEIREEHAPATHARARYGHQQEWAEPYLGVDKARTGLEAVPPNPLGKLPGSVWSIPSQPLTVPPHLDVDHFAAFPMELPRRCILGWSPPGVCVACGEGRRPVGDRDRQPTQRVHNGRSAMNPGDHNWAGSVLPHRTLVTITGYACACPTPIAPTRPSVILDPFGGTGTTALVASALGRTGITVDRSADYCRLARWRTTDPGERARAMQVPKPPPVPKAQLSIFDLDGEAS